MASLVLAHSSVRISEIYSSVQGEGEFAGTSSIFVRTTGCNLRCWFCDTPFTSWEPEGTDLSMQQILDQVRALEEEDENSSGHVVITGGEPMLQLDLVELTRELKSETDSPRFITIETAGTIARPVTADLMSVSPKLSNSTPSTERSEEWSIRHERDRNRPDVIRSLVSEYRCQFKFVIDQLEDVDEVSRYLAEFPEIDVSTVWLMPQATSADELSEKSGWVRAAAFASSFQFSSRWHIETYGNVRGR